VSLTPPSTSSRSGDANNDLGNTTRVSTNSSYIGFKGAEALGNGLTAVFQFESGVGFDNAGTLGATRDSFVGVAGGFGTVVLGNLTGPTRALGGAVDVNSGATGIGANSALLGKLGNNLVRHHRPRAHPLATCPFLPPACRSSTPLEERHCLRLPDLRWPERHRRYVANENKAFHGGPANTTGYDVA
jgi:hypothetical protein